jgi:translation initiation factor 1 (eIF-1/SUI1)
MKKKQKSIQKEWIGNILPLHQEEPLVIKNKIKKDPPLAKEETKAITGTLQIRYERQGRSGKSVMILHKFSAPEARSQQNLKKLCSELKIKLACGGTVENHEIILTLRDLIKLKETLKQFGITAL